MSSATKYFAFFQRRADCAIRYHKHVCLSFEVGRKGERVRTLQQQELCSSEGRFSLYAISVISFGYKVFHLSDRNPNRLRSSSLTKHFN